MSQSFSFGICPCKIDYYSKHGALPNASNATAHIVYHQPMVGIGESLSNLFSTHPRTEERIAKLKQQAMNPKYKEKALFLINIYRRLSYEKH